MTEPVITEGERRGAVWHKLSEYLDAQLTVLRTRNDKDLSEHVTARLRGRIDAVKALLSLGTDKPVLVSEDDIFKD